MPNVLQLPPLILHPFTGGAGTADLLDGSMASLALDGFVNSEEEEGVLQQRMLTGRYAEVRMLIFLGKDIFRWMRQCAEHVKSSGAADIRIVEQSFAALIVDDPPAGVAEKLEGWGVTDRRGVFSRAIGIHSLFQEPPPMSSLSPIFLKHYHRYADHAYICYQHSIAFLPIDAAEFPFELYASEEYTRLLAAKWELE